MVVVAAISIGAQLLGPADPTDAGGPSTSSPVSTRPRPAGGTDVRVEQTALAVVLRLAGRDLELKPSSYCWNGPPNRKGISPGICVDGWPQTKDLESVGSPASVDFWFGVEGWGFEATFTELGVDCPRQHTAQAIRTGDQEFRLDPAGVPGATASTCLAAAATAA